MPSPRRWQPQDHYYWLTALLAGRGLQRVTCGLIATTILGLGLIPLLLLLSDQGPTGTVNRTLAVAVAACCVAMACLWLRRDWPARWLSQSCVLLGSACIATSCLIVAQPAVGLVGAGGFTIVSVFTAMFHDGRYLAAVWTVGAVTLIVLATRLVDVDPVVTVCAILMFVLTNVFVAFVCRNLIRLIDTELHYGELDELTGLLTREAFTDRVATLIAARGRDDDRYLAVVVLSMDGFSLLTAMSGAVGGRQARVAIGHSIGETLRREAILAHVADSEFLIADTFAGTDISVLTDRLHQTVRTAPFRLTASIGVVTTPLAPLVGVPPHGIVDELVTRATSAMYQARSQGGQRTESATLPRLAAVDDADFDNFGDDTYG